MNEINVMILSAGRRVELVQAFQNSRDRLGISGRVIAVDISKFAPALYFADSFYIVPRISKPSYLNELISICKRTHIHLVVPTIDTELTILSEHREYFERETGARLLISNPELIEICQDKKKTAVFFKKNGFEMPKTYSEKDLLSEISFPLFIKPRDGSSSICAFRIQNRKELDFFLDYVKNPIVQECVSGQEYTLDVFSDFDSNIICIVPRQRLAVRSGEILKGKIVRNSAIEAEVLRMMTILKPIGHITVQGFLGEDQIMRYIEINPRFGGGAPMSFLAGADSTEWLYRLLLGKKLEPFDQFETDQVYLRFDKTIGIENA